MNSKRCKAEQLVDQVKSWRSLMAGAFFFVASLAPSRAQSFAIGWFTIDGGGGTSTGGVYAVSGTIGQPDAGAMSGGNYSLTGGFWGGYAVQAVGAPQLSIEHLAGGAVRVFWPWPATGFFLDQVSVLNGPPVTGWEQVSSSAYQTNATHISITVTVPTGNRFYRLRR